MYIPSYIIQNSNHHIYFHNNRRVFVSLTFVHVCLCGLINIQLGNPYKEVKNM